MKKSNLLTIALSSLGIYNAVSQELKVDALIRPRFEYRHGFQDVFAEGQEPSAFVSQRSSLLIGYKSPKVSTFLDLQDVSVWGDRPQLSFAAGGQQGGTGFRVNQAWAEIQLGNGLSTKFGRQILNYDDQRILGGVGWLQRQRTHDVAILRYKKTGLKIDLAAGFNQTAQSNTGNIFEATGAGVPLFQYKSIQFLHINGDLSEKLNGSFLFLNNTFQDPEDPANPDADTRGVSSRQTTGVYGKYKSGKFGLDFSTYLQFGEIGSNDLFGFQSSVNATYKVGSTVLGVGGEYLSGDEDGGSDGEIDAFFPLFGTNHKFNGYQDFFFVGRHANNAGLIDINAKAVFKTGATNSLTVAGHYFSTADDTAALEGYLGTSFDLVFKQKINSFSTAIVGYSHSFLDDDFEESRASGGVADDIQNWGWVMLVIKPNLFKWKKPTETK